MRAVIQRVKNASVCINGVEKRSIGPGMVILLGIHVDDTADLLPKFVKKCAGLRIFSDSEGKMNLSAPELGYSALVVSNFTLHADTKKGMRPSFVKAAPPHISEPLYDSFLDQISQMGFAEIQHGEFGADMLLEINNDGPITIVMDTDDWN